MSSLTTSLIIFACVFGGALLGIFLRAVLPQHHLSADSKEVVKLGMGLVATMTALVLGLLVASAKAAYDAQNTELTEASAKVILLDRILAMYGPETKVAREQLRGAVVLALDRLWGQGGSYGPSNLAPSSLNERLYGQIQALTPEDDMQGSLKGQALGMVIGLGQTRWLMFEQGATAVSVPMLVILVFWLTLIFTSFGLYAPPNGTVVASLFFSALSVAGALFLILEMYAPYRGFLQISAAPLRAALSHLGQ